MNLNIVIHDKITAGIMQPYRLIPCFCDSNIKRLNRGGKSFSSHPLIVEWSEPAKTIEDAIRKAQSPPPKKSRFQTTNAWTSLPFVRGVYVAVADRVKSVNSVVNIFPLNDCFLFSVQNHCCQFERDKFMIGRMKKLSLHLSKMAMHDSSIKRQIDQIWRLYER